MLWEASPVLAGTGSVPAQLVVLDELFVLELFGTEHHFNVMSGVDSQRQLYLRAHLIR